MTDERDDADPLIVAGLYDPAAPDAAARLELFEYLMDDVGVSIPELVDALDHGGLLSLGAFRTLGAGRDRFTIGDAASLAEIDIEDAKQLWQCAGFPEPRPFERRFGPPDVEMFKLTRLMTQLLDRDLVLQLVRTIGEAVSRIADAEVALLRSNVEAPLADSMQYADVARMYVAIANELFPRIADALDTLHRHHLLAVGRRYSDVGAPTSALNVVPLAVGFADLEGYTGLWERLDTDALARMLTQFEAITGDVIVAAGASVAKRIGDEVMFVTNAPGVGCALALDLLEACAAAGLPKLRVGLAFGDVMVRQGDFYGPTVNLAARLVAAAEIGTALTDRTLYDRLSRVRGGYTFVPAGRYTLSGFDAPVETFQLLRS